MQYLMGIDLGTTGLKVVVFDINGRLLGRGYSQNSYLTGPDGWAEQDPQIWWDGCCSAIKSALVESKVNPGEIAGIGVCGFHHCPVFLNSKGNPTRPSILTHDIRLSESLDDLKKTGVLESLIQKSGGLVTTGHFPPIYHYVLRHDREALKKTRWIILSKDYIRFRLTGKVGTEICDATGTNLVAMPEEDWSQSICELLNVPLEMLPDIGESNQICGEVTKEAAKGTGLKQGTPVGYGGGDSHCALAGLGVIGSGEVGLLLGTNSTLRASFEGFVRDTKHRVWIQHHVVPERYTVSASSMAGSSVLAWFKEVFYNESQSMDNTEIYNELESLAEKVKPGCDGLFFHPYIYGERSPFYNPQARGGFLGITYRHKKSHFVRSIMEGIGFCIANCFDLIKETAHSRNEDIKTIRIGESGGSRLKVWRKIISDILGMPLDIISVTEPGCLGAALLAGVGIGKYKNIQSAIGEVVRVSAIISPDSKNYTLYKEKSSLFNKTYSVIEPILYQ